MSTDNKSTREIFRYSDGERPGEKNRAIDPIAAHRKLGMHNSFNLTSDPALVDADDLEAQGRLIVAMRDIFGLKEWTEDADGTQHGATESETVQLFVDFMVYLVGLKKSTSQTLTSPSVTALTSPADASQEASAELTETTQEGATNESSDSGSTEAVPKSEPASAS